MTRPAAGATSGARAPKTVTDSRVEISRLMRPQDGNFAGNVHGGILLGLMDEVAHLCCTLEMVSAASPPVGRSP